MAEETISLALIREIGSLRKFLRKIRDARLPGQNWNRKLYRKKVQWKKIPPKKSNKENNSEVMQDFDLLQMDGKMP